MDQAVKEEVQKLLAQFQPERRSHLSRLFIKIGAGYAAMAVFTAAALFYFSFNLYAINSTARQIANTDLPVVTALVKLRTSLLAQEGFAGKYAIFKDSTFIQLFRQRHQDSLVDLQMLERSRSVVKIGELKRLYNDYRIASENLFSGKARGREKLHSSALRLIGALDELYLERQSMLQAVLQRADEQRKWTVRWAIGISCAGFLLAVLIAPLIIYRMILALGKLQKEAHRIASGDFNYQPQMPAVAEIGDLARDVNQMAAKIKEMERMNQESLPLTRLPGNQAIERVLDERLKVGAAFSFCHVKLDNFQPFLARYGYAKAGELLHETGSLIHSAVKGNGTSNDFAGHSGGENFVVVVSPESVPAVCNAIVEAFDAEVIKHLRADESEVERLKSPPGTTISIAVLDCDAVSYTSPVEIARAAVDVRESLNKGSGSSWGRVASPQGRVTP